MKIGFVGLGICTEPDSGKSWFAHAGTKFHAGFQSLDASERFAYRHGRRGAAAGRAGANDGPAAALFDQLVARGGGEEDSMGVLKLLEALGERRNRRDLDMKEA